MPDKLASASLMRQARLRTGAQRWAPFGLPTHAGQVTEWLFGRLAPATSCIHFTLPLPPLGVPGRLCPQDVRIFDPSCDPPLRQHYPFRLTAPQHTIIRDCEVGARGLGLAGRREGAQAERQGGHRDMSPVRATSVCTPRAALHSLQPPPSLAAQFAQLGTKLTQRACTRPALAAPPRRCAAPAPPSA